MAKKYFGTDGIRGAVNSKNINGDMFFKFGLATGTYFKTQKKKKQIAIIAKDTRLSGYSLEPALVSGLTSAGMHVYTLGPLPTNGLAMLTKTMKANMGIMITASHNPYHDNGLKLFGPDGLKLSNKIEKKIEILIDQKIEKSLSKPKKLGRVKRLETANKVVRMLTLKREWKHQFMNLTLKYPNIKNIKLVIITRNIRIIPDLFMKLYVRKIEKSSGVSSDGKFRFRGDYKVIGNDVRGFSVASDPTGKIARLAEIINKSRDKEKYIKDKNAFYFGDEEDYDELVNHSGLKKLHFYSVWI